MIFNSTPEAVAYLNKLLDEGVEVGLAQLNKILKNSDIVVERTILVEGKQRQLVLEEIEETENSKVALTLLSPSWIKTLPAIYHDNEFLQNFLFGFQLSALSHDNVINQIEKQFDPSNTDFVDWLCSWVGIRFSSDVDERAKRRVLHNLVRLYKIRGTKAYFIELIEYIVGVKVTIEDTDGSLALHGSLRMRQNQQRGPFFKVFIKERLGSNSDEEKVKLQMIHQIVKSEKPLRANYRIEYPFEHEELENKETKVLDMHYENSYDYDNLRD